MSTLDPNRPSTWDMTNVAALVRERDRLQDLAATMWLYVGHVGETNLTTEQKELLYDVLDAQREDGDPLYERWWRAALAVPVPDPKENDRD